MPEPWITIAPIRNLWRLPDGLQLPYQFNERVSLRPLPKWLLSEESTDTVDLILPELRKAIKNKARYCSIVEYQADALGSPDPEWKGDKPRAIQETVVEDIQNVFLSLWLVHPTTLYFREVAHIVNHGSERIVRQLARYNPAYSRPEHAINEYDIQGFMRARLLFIALSKLPLNGTLRTAVQTTMRALTEQQWILRFLILWLVMESLFGSEDARGEITLLLSQRVALFLCADRQSARLLFPQVKRNYAWRSKIVHGLRLAKLTPQKSDELIVQLEDVVRRSLLTVLSEKSLITTFDGKGREEYLDELVFK